MSCARALERISQAIKTEGAVTAEFKRLGYSVREEHAGGVGFWYVSRGSERFGFRMEI